MRRRTGAPTEAIPREDVLCRIVTRTCRRFPYTFNILSMPDYRFIFVNQAQMNIMRAFGFEHPDEALGKHPWDIIPGWKDALMDVYEEVRTRAEPRQLRDFPYTDGQRTTYWDVVAVPNVDERAGEVTSISTLGIEVTERKQTEEALRESEERYRTLVETSPDAIVVTDLDNNIIVANQQAAALYRCDSLEEIIGKSSLDFFAPEDRPRAVEDARKTLEIGTSRDVEYTILKSDGTRFPIELSVSRLEDSEGNPRGFIAVVRDITGRKRAEEELRRSSERITNILESITDAFIALDHEWRFTYVNAEAERLLQRKRSEIIGKSAWSEFPEAVVGRFYGEYHRAVSEQVSVVLEEFYAPLNIWVEVHAYPSPEGLSVYFGDITERKRAEQLSSALNTINTAIASTLDFDEIMRRAVVKAAEVIGAESAGIAMRKAGAWVAKYVYGLPEEIIGTRITDEEAPHAARAAETRQPVAVNDVYAEMEVVPEVLRRYGVRSTLFIPLVLRGEVIGFLAFNHHSRPVAFTEVEIDFAGKLGSSLSLALENARLYQAERAAAAREVQAREIAERRAEEAEEGRSTLQALMDYVPEAIAIVDAPDFRLRMTSRIVAELMGAPGVPLRGMPAIERGETWRILHADGVTPAAMEELPLTRAVEHGEVVTNEEWMIERVDGSKVPILASAGPIRDPSDRVIGGVVAFRDITPLKKDRESLEEAYHRERRTAQLLQRALLPTEPSIGPGYRLASRYLPAYAGEQIGGDFYDVFRTEDGKVGILIGDVAGKGIDAASLAAAARSTVRAFAYDMSSAGPALTHANAVLYAQQPEAAAFVTVFLAILDLTTGEICYSNAGHPPPIVYHAASRTKLLAIGQPPLGVVETYEFEQTEAHLNPRDKLIVYTDGLDEARRDSELFGTERVRRIIRRQGHRSPDDLIDELLAAANDWARGRRIDDTAIMAVEREAVPEE